VSRSVPGRKGSISKSANTALARRHHDHASDPIAAGRPSPRRSVQLSPPTIIEHAAAPIKIMSEDRPDRLAKRWAEARDRGPQWRDALERGRARLSAAGESALTRALALL
jgi:hypothetical protein